MKSVGIALLTIFLLTTGSVMSVPVGSISNADTPSTPLNSPFGFSVDYRVFNGTSWVKYVERDVGTNLECKVDLTDAVGLGLTLTVVLPAYLEFTNEANPTPTNTSGNDLGGTNLYWIYDTSDGSQTVTFHVNITKEGTFESLAAGIILLPLVSDSDSINITGTGENHPPLKPATPSGEDKGKIRTSYTYSTNTTDPEGDLIYYLWDWGDCSQSDWLGPFHSSDVMSVNHSWSGKASYQVKVKAKDSFNATSDWSDPLTVTMPRSSFFQRIYDFLSRYPLLVRFLRFLQDRTV